MTNFPKPYVCWVVLLQYIVELRDFVATLHENLPARYRVKLHEKTERHRRYVGVLQRLLDVLETRCGKHERTQQAWRLRMLERATASFETKQASAERCRLLQLPPEVRSKVYREVLIRNGAILVMPNVKQPAVLRCCVQIRREAISYYYTLNTFRFKMSQYEIARRGYFSKLIEKFSLLGASTNFTVRYSYTMQPDWANLYEWLKLIHEGTVALVPRPNLYSLRTHGANMLDAMPAFQIVQMLLDQPWASVTEGLTRLRRAIIGRDPRWR